MIYTVTFNPALDLVVSSDGVSLGGINKLYGEQIFIGGKGINVSLVLSQLGVRSKALGFVAGFTGEYIERGLSEKGIECDFVRLENGFTRINMKLKAEQETEFNGQGPDISAAALSELLSKLSELRDGDTVVLAGSIPRSLPQDVYEQILAKLSDRQVRAVVDATGQLLLNVLKYHPFLIKPNHLELSEMLGAPTATVEEIAACAARLQELGARNVLVSRAGDGAVLLTENGELFTSGVCHGEVKNSVGAGDSMVAGFVAGFENGFEHALKLGTACGGATAFSDGLCERDEVYRLLSEL